MKQFFYERRIKISLRHCLRALANLQQAFFVHYVQQDYIKNQLYYQRQLNLKSKQFFRIIVKTHSLIESSSDYWDIFCKINHLSEIVFSLNQLRFRVNDYSTFKICAQELSGIAEYSIFIFLQLSTLLFKKNNVDIAKLVEKIHDFEGIYNRALQIVSVDPFVFMFFIQDAYALYDEMQALHQAILRVHEKSG